MNEKPVLLISWILFGLGLIFYTTYLNAKQIGLWEDCYRAGYLRSHVDWKNDAFCVYEYSDGDTALVPYFVARKRLEKLNESP